jgi:uncharacterized protein YecE (DUF72 family)
VAEAFVGTSGWSYGHWRGLVYPAGTAVWDRRPWWLRLGLNSVEINSPFYRWPARSTFDDWRRKFPAGSAVTVKASQDLTHTGRLDPASVAAFAPRWADLDRLKDRRGVLLVQLPPSFRRDDERLDGFLASVPAGQRVAFEFRHPSWLCDEVLKRLDGANAAWVATRWKGMPFVDAPTADFGYYRLHGPDLDAPYTGRYSVEELALWSERIRLDLAGGRDAYLYTNNDQAAASVINALEVRRLLGHEPKTWAKGAMALIEGRWVPEPAPASVATEDAPKEVENDAAAVA